MNTLYEIKIKINDVYHIIKFKVLPHENIADKMYMTIQDDLFANIVFNCLKKDNNIRHALILGGYDINLDDPYEYMKSKVVPLPNAKKCHIKYIKEIIPCEGCVLTSGNQRDHMGYNGCLSDI